MGDSINSEFDKFQQELKKRNKHIKYVTSFDGNDDIDKVLNDLKTKEVIL